MGKLGCLQRFQDGSLMPSPNILRETHFANLGTLKTGKVRDIYFQPDKLILVATDRHSSFDRIIAHIPNKGAVLN